MPWSRLRLPWSCRTARPAGKRARSARRGWNRRASVESRQAWDLVGRLGGQLRVIPGAVISWDLGAVLALGAALGIEPMAAAEYPAKVEAVMVRRLNEAIGN